MALHRLAPSLLNLLGTEASISTSRSLLCASLDALPSASTSATYSASELSHWGQLVLSRGFARKKAPSPTASAPAAKDDTVKVVLLQAVPALGVKGSVVEANAGWVRYELFPLGRAVYATPENVQKHSMSAEERDKLEDPKQREQRRLTKLITSLTTMNVNISRRNDWFKKAPEKMLGSVTAWDVLQATERQYGVRLHESHLLMEGPITAFGTFKVPLNLRTKEDRQVELTVSVNSVRWINHGHAYV